MSRYKGAIQVLRNAGGVGGGCLIFWKKSITKVSCSMPLALWEGGGGPISRKIVLRNTWMAKNAMKPSWLHPTDHSVVLTDHVYSKKIFRCR